MNFYPLLLSDSQIVSSRFLSIDPVASINWSRSKCDWSKNIRYIIVRKKKRKLEEELKFFCSLAFFLSIDPLIKIKVRLIKDIRGYIIVRKKEIGKNFFICGIYMVDFRDTVYIGRFYTITMVKFGRVILGEYPR